MRDKVDLLRSLLAAGLICLLIWDAFLWFTDQAYRLLPQHRNMLYSGFLLWFVSAFFNRNSDDDWAGEY